MRALPFILFCLVTIVSESQFGQCPDRDSLWKRITLIRNSAAADKTGQLNELLQFDQQLLNCPHKIDSVYTFLKLSIGVVYYKLADFVHAIQYTIQALNIIQQNADNPAINKADLIRYYYYLSIYYDSLKLVSQKNEAIDSCISNELKANTNYHYTSLVLQDNVIDLYNKGDYNLCVNRSAMGEALIHKFYRYEDSLNQSIFFIYYKANALRSLRHYDEEEQFLQSKNREFQKIKSTQYQGAICSLFGYLSESKGNYRNAITYFKKALHYEMFSRDEDISAEVLNRIGMIYAEWQGQNKLALQYYYKALAHAKYKVLANANASDSFYIFGNIANLYARMKLFDSAYYFFQKAFDKIKQGINENDLVLHIDDYVNANTAEGVIKLVLDKADTYFKEYGNEKNAKALREALSVYKTADQLLNGIKVEQAELESKLFWRSYALRLYEHAIEASYLENNPADAFYYFEKSRAVLLNDQLNEQNKISDGDILKQAGIRRNILMLKRERDVTDVSSNHYIEVQKNLIANEQELDRLKQIIKKNNRLYYQSFFDTSFITLQYAKNYLLKDHQALLELFEGDSAIYVLLVTPGYKYFNKINKIDFDTTAKNYIALISNSILLNSRFDDYKKTANHLYHLIFQSNPLPAGRIIVSPDGYYFPFEALVANTNHTSPVYFLNDHAVSYTYSARYLMMDFGVNPSSTAGNFLGVAPVQYASNFSLAVLYGSDISLNQIGSYFHNSNNLIGNHATKNNFLREFSKYTIIQLYTHADDRSKFGEPVIHFADSALYLSDLIAEKKPLTRLVVLSACETGNGKLYQGEGVFSFNRGFASLGIPTAITNLWSVDNQSTYRLTELFYQYLSQGLPVDIAMQKAKLQFLRYASKENQLPYYWAAAIVAGKTEVLIHEKKNTWLLEVLIILTITAISFFVWRLSLRQKMDFHLHK